jgi:hypothetical protein
VQLIVERSGDLERAQRLAQRAVRISPSADAQRNLELVARLRNAAAGS